jgi:hypothetical protein
MKIPPDDAELLHYSREHLLHELTMLWETAHALPLHKEGSTEYVALIESFAIHLRNLLEFLFQPIRRDYVRALHFFDNPVDWKHTGATQEWGALYNRASHEVEHLTTGRVDGNPPNKRWPVNEILAKIEPLLKGFAATASGSKLHPKVRHFLGLPSDKMLSWIPDNVMHSNVASHTVSATALIDKTSSTASQNNQKGSAKD